MYRLKGIPARKLLKDCLLKMRMVISFSAKSSLALIRCSVLAHTKSKNMKWWRKNVKDFVNSNVQWKLPSCIRKYNNLWIHRGTQCGGIMSVDTTTVGEKKCVKNKKKMSLKYESCCKVAIMLFLSSWQDGGRLDDMNSSRGFVAWTPFTFFFFFIQHVFSCDAKEISSNLTNILKNASLIPSAGIHRVNPE